MRNEKGQKSNLICELASRTHDAERATRVARGCREEQDDAIDDPGDVEDDDRHNAQYVFCKVYFSAQPNKLRPILKFRKYFPVEHIFVPACSSARKIHFFKF